MFEKFALVPRFSRVKSFYKKAMIRPFPGGLTLYSYGTPVCTVCDEKIFRCLDGWSATTARHVNEFLQQCGFHAISKAEWMVLPVHAAESFARWGQSDEADAA